ncbi:hypothetical protein AtNW77_Chr5g0092971 [Arabidopsis thaliana]|uniref:CHCH domain-containing protein n=2 Tax=Arabidopsis TaxID=3701 RepID=A0A178UKN0_ARATH|nr:hypothetical protein ISN45_At05g008530 [Arabidopsis thaliana x Arabidopsis arenosa]OAO94100.1 hypothetical protein AXX17_AT5G09110 [Arabidopsis thaliana]VYS66345.1 unnamed protein product [Arabidopsis thaliana]
MPRGSSGGRSSYRPSRPAAARSPPPQSVNRAPPPATAQPSSGGSFLGNIGASITEGLAWGTGTAFGHRVVDSVMGPRTFKHETVVSQVPSAANTMTACDIHSKAFQDCVNHFGSDISMCQFYMDMLSECKKNSGSVVAA